jgi:excisionase family DNA binding protein
MTVQNSELISAEEHEKPALCKIDAILHNGISASKAVNSALPKLVGSNGEASEIPMSVLQVLQKIVDYMMLGKVLQVTTYNQAMDEQSAANFLNIGKEFLMELLDTGELPHIKIGTQRFVMLGELMMYKNRVGQERRQALAEMLQLSQETGTL